MGRRKEGGKEGWEGVKEGREERKGGKKGKELVNVLVTGKEEKKKGSFGVRTRDLLRVKQT